MSDKFLLAALAGQLHGEVRDQNVMVSATPSLLPADPLPGRKKLMIDNGSGSAIYLGSNTVTSDTGFTLAAGAQLDLALGRSGLYAVTAGPTVSGVHIVEIS